MAVNIVIGTQWGDEGKGKVIDVYAGRADVVVRSQGGNNAGHTVVLGEETYKLNLIPSGILHKNALCLIGAGVVINPKTILKEIDELEKRGITCDNLRIDPRAHVVMPWHVELDGLSEKFRGEMDIGTTRRGIGPCYTDKYERSGIRIYDLIHTELFERKAKQSGKLKNKIITAVYEGQALDLNSVIEEYKSYGIRLSKYVGDVSVLIHKAYLEGKNIMFEGAQATLLDIDFGTYPYVTSSHPLSAGVFVGAGAGPKMADDIIGVAKAYTTRVGKGPFPTELFTDIGDYIRVKGGEYGTTTGRARRIGWFDSLIVRHSVRVNGLTKLCINKLDTLCGLKQLMICTAYKKPDGTIIDDFPPVLEELADCEPVYETHEGFDENICQCKSFEQLPASCKRYIDRLESLCDCKIAIIGVGPERTQIIER
ncbi:MAG: adenylosuccinate synthase [Eubacterium sp.]|jgi:adenylosuccinate synthase|nr:adenylosuccinate synthase [Eubacterium sp.]